MGAHDPYQNKIPGTPGGPTLGGGGPATPSQPTPPPAAPPMDAHNRQAMQQQAIAAGQDPTKIGQYTPPAGPNITAAQAGQFHADPVQAVRSYYGGTADDQARELANITAHSTARANQLNAMGTQFANQANQAAAGYGANAAQAYGQQNQTRGQALDAVSQLHNFYQQGPGPSQAAALLNQQSDAAMAQNLALARSGRGAGDNAMAMRQAMFQNANQQQVLGQQQAANSAAEAANWRGQQLQAMGQEQNALGNIRGQDLGAYGQGQAGQMGFTGMGMQAQGALGQAAANQGQAGDALRAGVLGQQLGADQATNIANAGLGQQANITNAGFDYQTWAAQNNLAMQKYGIDKNVQMQNQAREDQFINGLVQAGATAGTVALAASDERVKRSVRADVFDLRPAQGYSYEYKDPSAPGTAPGRQFGPMAQDLERTPAGASTVRQMPGGTKAVDTSRLALVNTGAIAELQKKHDDLAAEIARIRGGR